jgi:hypothetical protein
MSKSERAVVDAMCMNVHYSQMDFYNDFWATCNSIGRNAIEVRRNEFGLAADAKWGSLTVAEGGR